MFGDGQKGVEYCLRLTLAEERGGESMVDAFPPLGQGMSSRQSLVNETGIENI